MRKEETLQLVTHNGQFHADEITAIALLHLFNKINLADVNITRTREQQIIERADIVLDVGGQYDQQTLRFDHHQIAGATVSSAGLVWAWIKKTNSMQYPEIDALIKAIDAHDCGVQMMPDFSFPHIIASYNCSNPYAETLQLLAFNKALGVALSLLTALIAKQQQRLPALQIIENAAIKNVGKHHVLVLPGYCKGWAEFINGQTKYKHISRVIWPDPQRDEWCIQVPAVKENDFTLAHSRLKPDSRAKFVHQSGFFAVYKSKDAILNMLRRESDDEG